MPPHNKPLTALFDYRERDLPQFSPNGAYYTFIAPDGDNLPTLWLAASPNAPTRKILPHYDHPLTHYCWAHTNEHILFLRDNNGDETWQLHILDLKTGSIKNIVARNDVRVQSFAVCPENPYSIVMSINARDRSLYDVYTYSLKTGRLTIVARNDGTVKRWLIDRSLRVRAKVVFSNDGSLYLYARRTIRSVWYLAHTWSPDERLTSGPLSFSPDNSTLYLTSSEGKDTCSLIALTLATGEKKEIAHDPQFDIYLGAHLEDVIPPLPPYQSMLFSDKAELVGFSYYTERLTWHFFDSLPSSLEPLKKVLTESSRQYWIIQETDHTYLLGSCSETEPTQYWIYQKETGALSALEPSSHTIANYTPICKQPITFKSRDGLNIHGYLALPSCSRQAPLVVKIHGGPWARDMACFEPDIQFLAHLGYACLQINYRGSTGYGKAFANAGDREWGARMIDDIVDGALWACDHKYTRPGQIALMGRSYGGYAALQTAIRYPDIFTCVVSEVPPTHLPLMLEKRPQHWVPFAYDFAHRLGSLPRDRALLGNISPALNPEKLTVPLLLAHGKHDFRVHYEQAEHLLNALASVGQTPTVLSFDNEGHLSRRKENIATYHKAVTLFLSKHLSLSKP